MTKAETFMIVDVRRKDPAWGWRTNRCLRLYARSRSCKTIGTADHSLNCARDLLFLTDFPDLSTGWSRTR